MMHLKATTRSVTFVRRHTHFVVALLTEFDVMTVLNMKYLFTGDEDKLISKLQPEFYKYSDDVIKRVK